MYLQPKMGPLLLIFAAFLICPSLQQQYCQDQSKVCPKYKQHCHLSNIYKTCPMTCGKCNAQVKECKDAHPNLCPNYKHQCKTQEQVWNMCPKTCGRCETEKIVDINECDTNKGGCAHICTNTAGSFTCSCNKGYSLGSDRKSCNEINECNTNNGGCAQMCTNGDGFFTCSCGTGYSLGSDVKSCDDINECNTNKGGCYQICTNSDGSFTCSCDPGYSLGGDRQSCFEDPKPTKEPDNQKECKDQESKCPSYKNHCSNDGIKATCPKTCGQCSGSLIIGPVTEGPGNQKVNGGNGTFEVGGGNGGSGGPTQAVISLVNSSLRIDADHLVIRIPLEKVLSLLSRSPGINIGGGSTGVIGGNQSYYASNLVSSKVMRDCNDLLAHYNHGERGLVYPYPSRQAYAVEVNCDQTTLGGGWTIIQRRTNEIGKQVNFHRKWDAYVEGFRHASGEGELWAGLDYIHEVTSKAKYELYIELQSYDSKYKSDESVGYQGLATIKRFARYGNFSVAGPEDNYRLTLELYSGDAGDSFNLHRNIEFTTTDKDNDWSKTRNCADVRTGGWWFNNCMHTNLNGKHPEYPGNYTETGIIWKDLNGGRHRSLANVKMMIRRVANNN